MLARFYLLFLLYILFVMALSFKYKKKEVLTRSLTLLLILHVTCFALWQGWIAFAVLIGFLLVMSLSEVLAHSKNQRELFGLASLFLFMAYLYNKQLLEWTVPGFIVISAITFAGRSENIKSSPYLLAFSLAFLVPCSIFLRVLRRVREIVSQLSCESREIDPELVTEIFPKTKSWIFGDMQSSAGAL